MRRLLLLEFDIEAEDEWGRQVSNLHRDLMEYDVEEIHEIDLTEFGDTPEVLNKYLVLGLDEDGYMSIDMAEVANLMEYVVEKPLVVCTMLFKMQAALSTLYSDCYSRVQDLEDDFKSYTAERTAHYADRNNGLSFKRTAKNIESHVKAEETWKAKQYDLNVAKQTKSNIYTAKELVKQAYDLCKSFVDNGRNVTVGDNPKDHTFQEVITGVAGSKSSVETYEFD